MKAHEEDTCRFKLKAMQEAQRITKQKGQQKSKATTSEGFAIAQTETSKFLDESDDIEEIPEMKEFLDNMETEVCNHYIIPINPKHDIIPLILQF
jgi:hypothetical protein